MHSAQLQHPCAQQWVVQPGHSLNSQEIAELEAQLERQDVRGTALTPALGNTCDK